VIIFVELKPRMIGLGLSYEMLVIRSVNMLYVDNVGPSSIGGLRRNFGRF
jgi:ABC-type glucose/galactose transport system permease subunit